MPNEIPVFFYTRSNYDYHFIMKKLVNEFKVQFECHGENKEKHKTFSAQKKKKKNTKVNKDGYEDIGYYNHFLQKINILVV